MVISTCVVFLLTTDTMGTPKMEAKILGRGYKALEKKDPLMKKI